MQLFYMNRDGRKTSNSTVTLMTVAVMLCPGLIHKIGLYVICALSRWKIIRHYDETKMKWDLFVDGYGDAVLFLKNHKEILWELAGLTFLQRCSVFLVTYLVYRGFSLSGSGVFTIMALQASIYIAVDMLPVPGSQGITELMYQKVFSAIFPLSLLTPSMIVSRSVNFYLLLLISMIISGYRNIIRKIQK